MSVRDAQLAALRVAKREQFPEGIVGYLEKENRTKVNWKVRRRIARYLWVLRWRSQGTTYAEIGIRLGVHSSTVRTIEKDAFMYLDFGNSYPIHKRSNAGATVGLQ